MVERFRHNDYCCTNQARHQILSPNTFTKSRAALRGFFRSSRISTLLPMSASHTPQSSDTSPPVLPSWRAWYLLVLVALAAEIGFFVWLSQWLSA